MVPYAAVDRKRQGNPTGHNIIFVKPGGSDDSSELEHGSLVKTVADKNFYDSNDVTIYCFFPNQGN